VVAAEGLDAGAVPEPAQRENRLAAARKFPAPGVARRRRSAASSRDR
jgi:hypothetical protein